jgi:hypothetical protein
MISRPPKMEIQQSMLRSYHAFANSHLLISVTFSTPTGDYTQNPRPRVNACNRDVTTVTHSLSVQGEHKTAICDIASDLPTNREPTERYKARPFVRLD